jgi:hypothetical protein
LLTTLSGIYSAKTSSGKSFRNIILARDLVIPGRLALGDIYALLRGECK